MSTAKVDVDRLKWQQAKRQRMHLMASFILMRIHALFLYFSTLPE